MRQAITRFATFLLKSVGIVILFTGLALVSAHHFFWGLLIFVMGIVSLGLQEEGWN